MNMVSWAAAPKGSMTYAFTHMGKWLGFWPLGWDLDLEAEILASRLVSGPGWDLGLLAGI